MSTLSQPDRQSDERLAALPRLPRDEGGPVFAEPWQAQAFALAVKLSEQGHFTWKEWAGALAAVRLDSVRFVRQFFLAAHKTRTQSPACRAFLRFVLPARGADGA